MAGASLVGVGTALWLNGAGAAADINTGIQDYLVRENLSAVADIPKLERGNG
jgi:dihydroorotate dehydrogenase